MKDAKKTKTRCDWAEKSELERVYHDEEWGRLVKDDAKFFELIVLEGFQAGISWHAVLLKREAMRAAFDGFDAHKISLYGEEQTAKFMPQTPAHFSPWRASLVAFTTIFGAIFCLNLISNLTASPS